MKFHKNGEKSEENSFELFRSHFVNFFFLKQFFYRIAFWFVLNINDKIKSFWWILCTYAMLNEKVRYRTYVVILYVSKKNFSHFL